MFVANTNHWAFMQGALAGKNRETAKRGLMIFGLSCAATSLDRDNTKQWLAGFDSIALPHDPIVKNDRSTSLEAHDY